MTNKPAYSLKQRLLRGGAWALSGKAMFVALLFVINILLARLLPPAEVGAYFMIFSLVNIGAVVSNMGLTKTLVRLVARSLSGDADDLRSIVSSAFLFNALGVVAVAAIGFAIWDALALGFLKSELIATSMTYVLTWIAFLSFMNLSAEAFRGAHDIRFATIFGGVFATLLTTAALVFFYFSGITITLHKAILVSVSSTAISVVVSMAIIFRWVGRFAAKSTFSRRDLMIASMPIMFQDIFQIILNQCDVVILGALASPSDVAIYASSLRISAAISLTLIIINSVIQPVISELYFKNEIEKLQAMLRKVAVMAALPSIAIFVLFASAGGFLLEYFFGEFYKSGGTALAVLSLGHLANVLSGSCGVVLIMAGFQRITVIIALLSAVIFLPILFFSVQAWGLMGAAWSFVALQVFQNGLLLYNTKKHVGVWTHASFNLKRS